MIKLAQRIFAVLLLASPLMVGCGDSSKSNPDAAAQMSDAKPSDATDDTITPVSPDGLADVTPLTPDSGTPTEVGKSDAPLTTDAAVDRAATDVAGEAGSGDAGTNG